MTAVDVVRRYMQQFGFGLHDGSIFKKAPEGKYTFVFCQTVHVFIHNILGHSEVAEMIGSHVTQLISLLSAKASRLIKPILIDFIFIEEQPAGTCFNIERKRFEVDPKDLKGSLCCSRNFFSSTQSMHGLLISV